MDITREEFWNDKYQGVRYKAKKESAVRSLISKNKIVKAGLLCFGICTLINIFLIYGFFTILTKL